MPSAPANDFLERLDRAVDFKPIEAALHRMYPARTGHPPHPPLVLFKMSLLQHCYGLSDPQCEELVADRMKLAAVRGLGLAGQSARRNHAGALPPTVDGTWAA